jgi:uncharacterized protein involved in exopolysaccharide biosynthesis
MTPLELIDEIIDILRRRWRLITRTALLGMLVSAVIALQTPREYEAVEVIQIERPVVSADTVEGAGDSSSARLLQQIQQRLFTRESVLGIADEFGLFDETPALSEVERVALMRESVSVVTVAAAREGFADDGTISVVMVTAKWSDAELARDLAHEFANRTLELSANLRLEGAQQSVDFFRLQEETLNGEIAAVEDEREAFRNENALAISGSIGSLQDEIGAINGRLLDIDEEILTIRGQIDQLAAGDRTSEVAQTRARVQIEGLESRITALVSRRDGLNAEKTDRETLLARVPIVERRLNDYDRALTQLQDELSLVSGRRREAETAYALEAQDHGGRLTVIEAATVPEYPGGRSRKMTVAMGLVAGLMLGGGIVLVLELLQPVIRSSAQMTRRVGLTPVVTIPSVGEGRRRDRRRRGQPPLGTL